MMGEMKPLSNEELDRLEVLASKAFPQGEWRFSPSHIEEAEAAVRARDGWIICTTSSDAGAEFIAAVDPPTVRALIAMARRTPPTTQGAGDSAGSVAAPSIRQTQDGGAASPSAKHPLDAQGGPANSASTPSSGHGEEWALVPRKVTPAMQEAVRENGGDQAVAYALAAWPDLLSAAPPARRASETEAARHELTPMGQALAEKRPLADVLEERRRASAPASDHVGEGEALGHQFEIDRKSGIRLCARCGKADMRSTPPRCERTVTVPPMTDDQREYLAGVEMRPQPYDPNVIIGGPRRPAPPSPDHAALVEAARDVLSAYGMNNAEPADLAAALRTPIIRLAAALHPSAEGGEYSSGNSAEPEQVTAQSAVIKEVTPTVGQMTDAYQGWIETKGQRANTSYNAETFIAGWNAGWNARDDLAQPNAEAG